MMHLSEIKKENTVQQAKNGREQAIQLQDNRVSSVTQKKQLDVLQNKNLVKPTLQLKDKVNVNDDKGLENEADVMGAKAMQLKEVKLPQRNNEQFATTALVQRKTGIKQNSIAQLVIQKNERVGDLKAAGETFTKVINLNMAGSGNDTLTGDKSPGVRIDGDADPTAWLKQGNSEITISVAGPGGPSTKGVGSHLKGISDSGSNSINANVLFAVNLLQKLIGLLPAKDKILLLITAHSRGAVAATRIANLVQAKAPHVTVELVLFDPVPGPLHSGPDVRSDISGIPQSTIVYSVASGYPVGFTPQNVLGAKRIIISKQNHGGGLQSGYNFNGTIVRGSRLNSLPQGIFLDDNTSGTATKPLKKVGTIEGAKLGLFKLYRNSSALFGDKGRLKIIRSGILHHFFEVVWQENSLEATFGKIWENIMTIAAAGQQPASAAAASPHTAAAAATPQIGKAKL